MFDKLFEILFIYIEYFIISIISSILSSRHILKVTLYKPTVTKLLIEK